MKNINIKFVSKEELQPAFGRAYSGKNEILIREDLSLWTKMAVIVHEIYHLQDKRKNVLIRELKAIAAQFFMSFFGSFIVVFRSLSYERLKFYFYRIKKGE